MDPNRFTLAGRFLRVIESNHVCAALLPAWVDSTARYAHASATLDIGTKRQTPSTTKRTLMQNISPRHVEANEATRLGVQPGWYGTKVSGTFVTGPHTTQADCRRKIGELDAPEGKH